MGLFCANAEIASAAGFPVLSEIACAAFSTSGVSVYPGQTAFAVTPDCASSIAKVRIQPITPCFAAE